MPEIEGVKSVDNPNETWVDSKGVWLTYVLMIVVGHLVILSVPFFDTPMAWTITNNAHNLVRNTMTFRPRISPLFADLSNLLHFKCVDFRNASESYSIRLYS